ncbi:MAG: NAD(P)/FAD-dependent oxidoreductase, partial [Prochlorothrix sp.]
VLYLRPDDDLPLRQRQFQACLIPPLAVDALTAIALEPQLNAHAIQGALVVPQGHVHGGKTVNAYLRALERRGGTIKIAAVQGLVHAPTGITGIHTPTEPLLAPRVILATGGYSRSLLAPFHLSLPLYFTHAIALSTPYTTERLRCMVMPADLQQRPALESRASQVDWQTPQEQCLGTVLEAGAVQFLDGHCFFGQISQLVPAVTYRPDLTQAQQTLQTAIADILPRLALLPTTCHHCLVAFTPNPFPLVGNVPSLPGLSLFTGFTHPLVYAPPLARRFAQWLGGHPDPVITAIAAPLQTLEAK